METEPKLKIIYGLMSGRAGEEGGGAERGRGRRGREREEEGKGAFVLFLLHFHLIPQKWAPQASLWKWELSPPHNRFLPGGQWLVRLITPSYSWVICSKNYWSVC